jgi:hypothetical protein
MNMKKDSQRPEAECRWFLRLRDKTAAGVAPEGRKGTEQMNFSRRIAAWWPGFMHRHIVGDWPFGGDMQ